MKTLSLKEIFTIAKNVLEKHGFSEECAAVIAKTMTAGERDGCASHGIYRLLGCINTLKAGKVIPDAAPEVRDVAPAIVAVDAKGGFSQPAFEKGFPMLCDKAKSQGIAALAINHCVHFSALWVEIEMLTAQGLVAIACNPSHAWVTPHGGKQPLLGTNPIAFGWPRVGKDPYVFDFATSAIARGEIELHKRHGTPLQPGWAVDAQDEATTDPQQALDGAMLTFGGHKGSALSTMIELLAGPLIGDLTSLESMQHDNHAGASPYHGELIIAFSPEKFLGAGSAAHMARAEDFFAYFEEDNVRMPSQRRFTARKKSLQQGVEISDDLYQEIMALLK